MGIKADLRIGLNKTLEPMGFFVARFSPETNTKRMLSPQVLARQIKRFRHELSAALRPFSEFGLDKISDEDVLAFLRSLFDCPVRQQSGGCGTNAATLLWALARLIQPPIVVESGVLRGFTTWVLEQAVPTAEIHAFDISFKELRWRSPTVHYHEVDWMSTELAPPVPARALAFFDDHVDQWSRIRQAAERGFRYAVFDDSFPATCLHSDGQAACPTIDMLFDDELGDGELIEWQTDCGYFSYRHDRSRALDIRSTVEKWVRLPPLHFTLGYAPANLTLIALTNR